MHRSFVFLYIVPLVGMASIALLLECRVVGWCDAVYMRWFQLVVNAIAQGAGGKFTLEEVHDNTERPAITITTKALLVGSVFITIVSWKIENGN